GGVGVGRAVGEIDADGGPPDAQAETAEESDERADQEASAGPNGAGATAEQPGATEKATSDDSSVSAGRELGGGGLEIVMPEMGESVTEGEVLEWHVSEGDAVEEGQTIVEVSTDKVDAEVPAPASGTITKIVVGPDETVEVGKPLAEMTKGEGPSGDRAAAPAPSREGKEPEPAAASPEAAD